MKVKRGAWKEKHRHPRRGKTIAANTELRAPEVECAHAGMIPLGDDKRGGKHLAFHDACIVTVNETNPLFFSSHGQTLYETVHAHEADFHVE